MYDLFQRASNVKKAVNQNQLKIFIEMQRVMAYIKSTSAKKNVNLFSVFIPHDF